MGRHDPDCCRADAPIIGFRDLAQFILFPSRHFRSSPLFKDYETKRCERYPDPAYLLPISAGSCIFCAQGVELSVTLNLEGMKRLKGLKEKDAVNHGIGPGIGSGFDPDLIEKRAELVRKIAAHIHVEGPLATAIPGLRLSRRIAPTEGCSAAYEPELVVFAQGEKRITVGGATHVCDGSTFLLTSIDLPVVSQITKASRNEPYLGLVLKLQMPVVREILSQEEFLASQVSFEARGMAVGKTSIEMLGACCRLLDLLDTPCDISFLGSLMQREIIYRLLRGPLGEHLRAIATLGEQSNRTAKAVAWLKANFNKPLRVEELASVARMGVSTLHHQFRSLTAMSPLQY